MWLLQEPLDKCALGGQSLQIQNSGGRNVLTSGVGPSVEKGLVSLSLNWQRGPAQGTEKLDLDLQKHYSYF